MSTRYFVAYCWDCARAAEHSAVNPFPGEQFTRVKDRDDWAAQHVDDNPDHVVRIEEVQGA